MGQSPDGSTYNDRGDGVPLINGPTEFGPDPLSKTRTIQFTNAPTKMCKANDVILCVRGSTTGRMNIAGCDACIGRGVAAIRSENTSYIAWALSAMQDSIHSLAAQTGSTFPNITQSTLSAIEIPLPPKEIQEIIVQGLTEEQKLVEANKKLIALFEAKIKGRISSVWET